MNTQFTYKPVTRTTNVRDPDCDVEYVIFWPVYDAGFSASVWTRRDNGFWRITR